MQDEKIHINPLGRRQEGQSLVEYALILVLVGIAFGFALAATGPAIGNVFSNTIYNLLGQEPDVREVAQPGDFWLTVTWVATNPIQERPLPTRTQAPPSSTPTPGSPPPPTPVTPSRTPFPTPTPAPTATPSDYAFTAPWLETVDHPEYWRVGAEPFLGVSDWIGSYYNNNNLSGSAVTTMSNQQACGGDISCRSKLDFNWGSAGPITGVNDNFSASFTRDIYWDSVNPIDLIFTLRFDDAARLYLLGAGQTTGNCPECLVINNFTSGYNTSVTAVRQIQPGAYKLVVDYREFTGGALLKLDINIRSNEDDRFDPTGDGSFGSTAADCAWTRADTEDNPNSLDFMWEEYGTGNDDFKQDMRCFLELRGYVTVPATMVRPEFVFWDVWDFADTNRLAYVQIAEYIPDPLIVGKMNRPATVWHTINLHNGSTRNYNWTRNVVNLTDVLNDGGSVNMLGKNVTFRFGMQVRGNSGSAKRWYIDDVEFADNGYRVSRDFLPGTRLNLNQDSAKNDFLTTGQWELTANNALPDFDNAATNPTGCCSWELRPGTYYTRFSLNGGSNTTANTQRVHTVELNGWVNMDPALADDKGDTGDPLLEFYQAFYVSKLVGLEVQYTTDDWKVGEANWQVIPGPSGFPAAGLIRDVNLNSSTGGDQRTLTRTTISLAQLKTMGINRFRLRFAMRVRNDADLLWGKSAGWWIDEIYLHREGAPKFLDYPFYDSAEIGMDNWLTSGQWYRTNLSARTEQHSFTDSPTGDYSSSTNTYLRTIDPIDFLNDTPANLALTDRNPAGGNSNTAGAAVDPVLTFWHYRSLNSNDAFYVEWRRKNQTDNDWKVLWTYIYKMNTRSTDTNTRSAVNLAWEYVEVELEPMLRTFTGPAGSGDLLDDDILFRFRLYADGSNVADGVFVDDISIKERQETSFKLWAGNATINSQTVLGNGVRFGADGDETDWFDRWRMGGDWQRETWEQQNGLGAFHESPVGQTEAGVNRTDTSKTNTRVDTYSILEIAPIIDLRGTDPATKPTMYFWNRHGTGDDDQISVQISSQLNMTASQLDIEMGSRCANNSLPQCYDQLRGWSPWVTSSNTATWPWYQGEYTRGYGWTREQVDLTSYAGKRIRIRFVYNALDRTDKRDGWYIDNVLIGPRQDAVLKALSAGAFTDSARNLKNWVAEGNWGLDPEFYRGAGGGPATLGTWQEYMWNCPNCESLVGGTSSTKMARGADLFLDTRRTNMADANSTRTVLDINYDMRSNSPIPGPIIVDKFLARWVLTTPVIGPTSGVQAGDYTFIAVSDDGVRMKWEEVDASGNSVHPTLGIIPSAPASQPADSLEWNLFLNWSDHGRVGDMGTVTFVQGKRYRLTAEWYDKSGDAVLILTTGGSSFSFTDSPKQGAGAAFPDVPQLPNANTSLVLNGTLDLAGTTNPIIEYYTMYETWATTRVEVSTDGGFTWTGTGLDTSITYPSGATENFSNPSLSGDWIVPARTWQQRRHNLTAYVGQKIMVRFRYDSMGRDTIYENRNTTNNVYNGWWIVDIRIGQ